MRLIRQLVLVCACLYATAACAAAPGPFVLTDPSSGFPILSCVVPKGWVAGGKVMWLLNPSQPVRHYAIATDPKSGEKMILGSTVTLLPSNPYTKLDQAVELTSPAHVARTLTAEIVGLYGLQNVRVAGATFTAVDANKAKPIIDRSLAEARASMLTLTKVHFGILRLRFVGQLRGQPRVVNCLAPYLLLELNGVSSLGTLLSVDSYLTAPGGEKLGQARLEAFAGTRKICLAFELYCKRMIQQNTLTIIRSQNECLDLFLRTARENANRVSAANARWCDAIRGEERVINPHTGRETFVSTQYDHCRIGANGETLYWNADGAGAGFDPNTSPAFNHTTWSSVKK